MPQTLVEIWQANAAGRYAHGVDNHAAPLDPNFSGTGRAITDEDGRYRFLTIMPGRYPFQNHYNAWRPAHVHFSLLGPNFLTRLVTQMFFPGDPLQAFDPIYQGVPEHARDRVVASVRHRDDRAGLVAGLPIRSRAARSGGNALRNLNHEEHEEHEVFQKVCFVSSILRDRGFFWEFGTWKLEVDLSPIARGEQSLQLLPRRG